MNKLNIFLDLEGVIIPSWDDRFQALNINKKIKNIVKGKNVDIFSYAIYSDSDEKEFNKVLKNRIEDDYECKIDTVTVVADLAKSFLKKKCFQLEIWEFCRAFDKTHGFLFFCDLIAESGQDYMLIDDMVDDAVFSNGTKNYNIIFRNSNNL